MARPEAVKPGATRTRLLVIVGTPIADSLNHALAAEYAAAARAAGAEVELIDLATGSVPGIPTTKAQLRAPELGGAELEPGVAASIESLRAADHVAIFFPQWWGTYPAALTSFIDRVFLSGSAFRYHDRGFGWDRLLTGRTARLVMTMDSPRFWNRFVYRNAAETSLRRAVLGYCGVRTIGVARFDRVRFRAPAARTRWLAEAAKLGVLDAARSARRR